MPKVNAVVVVSSVQFSYLRRVGVGKDRIVVLPNAVDLELFRLDEHAALAFRQRYGLERKFIVGFVGFMRPWHDIKTLLEGLYLASQSRQDIYGLIVGDGPSRPALECRAKEMGLSERITFVEAVPHQEVVSFIGCMDVSVF